MADYSTTIGVFQSQVGKSGDILLKFEHKNGGERGIRHERSEVSRSDSDGNPIKNHAFCAMQKAQSKNKKLKGKFTCNLEFYYFCSDFLTSHGKKAKKMAEKEGFEPSESCPSAVFKTAALNHSTISPQSVST